MGKMTFQKPFWATSTYRSYPRRTKARKGKKMPAAYEAKSLRNLKATLDLRWPNRDRRTDGWIGDAAHKAQVSDHNPDPNTGVVRARDIDKDGIVPEVVVAACILHPATRYVIYNRRIYRVADHFRPRVYDGSNPHTDHIHESILHEIAAENSPAPWEPIMGFKWPELRAGVNGRNSKALQALLNAWGASLVVDGLFGRATDSAVRAFQSRRHLRVDGLVGPRTQAALAQSA